MPIQAGQEFIYHYITNIPQGNKADRFEIRVTPNDQVDPVHNHTNSAESLTNWKQVRLAPNPIQNSEIRLVNLPTSSELTQIELRDLNGKSIQAWTEFKKLQSRSNELTLEIQKSLPAGLYFIELHHKKGNIVLPLNVE
jgi:hypothetical protein